MDLTFSSLFTTTFYSSVLFLCIFFMLKKANRMRQVGVRTLIRNSRKLIPTTSLIN